jgi:sirohydrochlorin cobaltochelatase
LLELAWSRRLKVMPQESSAPIILLAHGSPDPDWRRPLEEARDRLRERMPERRVELAFLEHTAPSLGAAVAQLAVEGHTRATVMAAFLSGGGNHIKKHVPQLVADVALEHPGLDLHLVPGALGAEPEIPEALAKAAARLATTA